MKRMVAVGAIVLVPGFMLLYGQTAARTKPCTTWSAYEGSPDSMQYSALDQINKNNVKQLQEAWFFPVPSDPPYERLPFNPLVRCL